MPGNANDVIAHRKQFDEGIYDSASYDNVHTVAAVLKLWLREIPEPIFPFAV